MGRGVHGGVAIARRSAFPLTLVPAVLFLALIYVGPVLSVLRLSVLHHGVSFENFRHALTTPIYLRTLLTTVEVSFLVTVFTAILGYAAAYTIATTRGWAATLGTIAVVVPLFTSLLVRNYAWIFMLDRHGVVNSILLNLHVISSPLPLMFNRFGVIVGMVHILLPYLIIVTLGTMRGIDRRLIVAAASLGATPVSVFRRVFLPLSLPGLAGGVVLVFILAIGFFVTPAMLGGQHDMFIANVIIDQVGFLNWGFAAALSTLLLLVALCLLVFGRKLIGPALTGAGFEQGMRRTRVRATAFGPLLDRVLGPVWPGLPRIAGVGTLLFLIVPIVLIVPLSFSSSSLFVFPPPSFSTRWYTSIAQDAAWRSAAVSSVEIALITTILTVVLAIPASYGLVRSRSRWTSVAYALILSPMIVPSIIIAIGVFRLSSILNLTGTIWGVALGHTIGALPLAVITVTASLRGFDVAVERAAQSLGATPIRTALRITLPILTPTVVAACLLAFIYSFDELPVALFVSGISAETLPKKMWESLQEIDPTIAAVSVVLIALTATAALLVAVARRAERRRIAPQAQP